MFEVADLSIFQNRVFGGFSIWVLYCFFARIFILATPDPWKKANDGLWRNYIFYKIPDVIFSDFSEVQKTLENITKSDRKRKFTKDSY